MSPSLPKLRTKVEVTSMSLITIQSASSAPVPGSVFKIVGREISTMELSIDAISDPMVVLLKTVHL